MTNKESNFDYDDVHDDLELRERDDKRNYWWILWVIILVVIIVAAFFVFQGNSESPFFVDWNTEQEGVGIEEGKSVKIEEMALVVRESFPVQIAAQIKGTLTDKCTEISDISQLRDGNTFYVDIKAGESANCEVGGNLEPVEYIDSIELETIGLPKGTYDVNINGIEDSFTLEMDNQIDLGAGEQK